MSARKQGLAGWKIVTDDGEMAEAVSWLSDALRDARAIRKMQQRPSDMDMQEWDVLHTCVRDALAHATVALNMSYHYVPDGEEEA